MKIRWIIYLLVIFIIGGSFAAYPIDRYRMKKFCGSISVGEGIESVRNRALEHAGFRVMRNYERNGINEMIIHSPWSFGRFTCIIENNGRLVTKAKFNFLD